MIAMITKSDDERQSQPPQHLQHRRVSDEGKARLHEDGADDESDLQPGSPAVSVRLRRERNAGEDDERDAFGLEADLGHPVEERRDPVTVRAEWCTADRESRRSR